jgi:hypothetical protein
MIADHVPGRGGISTAARQMLFGTEKVRRLDGPQRGICAACQPFPNLTQMSPLPGF